ncbi:hypothetical protein [Pyxidicoccus sp. MSG2]|uniref:hypothetical protein n=1 Tax=Pyxidicoccus sp. MSG2 TaxID=2996790 RepID=UPI00226F29FC|nr:hypothetical protein [Pyxidicoccus sp. MSG2]MCY1019289.1 hypothetical protein [Pyxidicoccus sp. MSG2]
MTRFLQKLVTVGARPLGALGAPARAPAKSSDALLDLVEEESLETEDAAGPAASVSVSVQSTEVPPPAQRPPAPAARAMEPHAPRGMEPRAPRATEARPTPVGADAALQRPGQARAPRGDAEPPQAPSDSAVTATPEPKVSPDELATPVRQATPGAPPATPGSKAGPPKASRTAPLRDADIRVAEPGSPASVGPRGSAAPVAPGMSQGSLQAVTADATGDALAPFKERWKDLAQRLRASHPPPLPEAVHAQQAPSPAPAPEAPVAPRAPAAPSVARPAEPRVPVSRQPGPVPPRARPSEAPGARPGGRARELVIGNLEVRVMSSEPRAPERREARPEPQGAPAGAWQTAARHYLGRL